MAAAHEFSGQEHFLAPPERVFGMLTDLAGLAASLPDVQSWELVDPQTLKCVVRPGFSFIRGTLKSVMRLSDVVPPESAVMQVEATGIGVSMKIESQMHVVAEGTGARLDWQARVTEMKGLVATVSPALVKAAADQTVRNTWQQVRQQLGES